MDKYVASYKEPYNLINQSFFIIDEQLKNITNEQVFNYSEKVKGKLEIIVNEEQIIPQSLVELFEKLYTNLVVLPQMKFKIMKI